MSAPELVGLRLPPHSNEAEQSLLGAVLLDNTAFEKVSWLAVEAFYSDRHRRLWACLSRLIEAGRQADVVTVPAELGGELEKVGGPAYIAGLAQNTPSAINVKRYADLVHERSVQRELATVATQIAEEALSPVPPEIGRLVDEAESRILQVAEKTARRGSGPSEISALTAKVLERIDHLHHSGNHNGVTGVPSGFIDLDAMTAGLQPQDLIIVAGRPSIGKTAFALNVAEHVALHPNVRLPVAIFSMEMSGTQLTSRLLASIGKIDAHKMRTGRLSDDEWGHLTDAMAKLQEARIVIDDSGALNALELRARARRLKRRYGKLGLVVVDYLQLMEAKARGENRATEVSEISRSLKAMAKELDCPVIALSQLSRKVDERPDHRPVLSDLRESGAIEQDADVVLFVYRDEVYYPDQEEAKGRAELIIGKQRNGPIGTVHLTFLGRYTRFANCTEAPAPMDFRPGRRKAKAGNFAEA
jgi:replicative DNA helicase